MPDKTLIIPYSISSTKSNLEPTLSTQVTITNTVAEQTTTTTVTKVSTKEGINIQVSGVGETSVPTSDKFKRALDQLNILDSRTFTLNKLPSTEIISNADVFAYIVDFRRTPTELLQTTSLTVKSISKISADTFNNADVTSKSIDSIKNNTINIVDVKYVDISKLFNNTFIKNDAHNILTDKLVIDTLNTVENLDRTVEFLRSFEDYVDATDDYYGLANLDDDQYAHFDKRLISLTYPQDVDVKESTKILATTFNRTDTSRSLISLSKLESVSYTDLVTLRPRKSNVETVDTSVVVSKLYTKPRTELLSGVLTTSSFNTGSLKLENLSINFEVNKRLLKISDELLSISEIVLPALFMPRQFLDTFISAELINFAIAQTHNVQATATILQNIAIYSVYTSQLISTDLFNRDVQYIRDFVDSINATDDYYGLANIDDDQTALFNKNVVSNSYYTDLLEFLSQTTYQDILQINDSNIEHQLATIKQSTSSASDTSEFNTQITAGTESVTAVQTISKYLAGILNTQYTSTELASVLVEKVTNTSYTTIDSTTNYYEQVTLDTVPIVDSKLLQLDTVYSDTSNTQIEVRHAAEKVQQDAYSVLDNISSINDLVTLITSTNSVQDSIDILSYISYAIAEVIAITDSGYANNQNYFAEAYVEPGYVGTNSNF